MQHPKQLRILLTGSNGQVGRELRRTLKSIGDVLALDRDTLDLTRPELIRSTIREYRPGLIINAAAYTAVDRAESEPELAMAVNGVAPGVLAEEAHRLNAVLVHYSTDYVFDGTKPDPYLETDAPNPLSVYGRTKLAGELAVKASGVAHYTLRTSWVYAVHGANFINTILRLSQEREQLRIVNDQTGAPTSARAIAEMTAQLLGKGLPNSAAPRYGLYHLTATGAVTWFGFASALIDGAKKLNPAMRVPEIIPISTAEYPLPARRPANSRLNTAHLTQVFGIEPESWEEMLTQHLNERHRS